MVTFTNSDYNALQTRVVRRLANHFMVQGTYTFSKSLDQSSSAVTDTASIANVFSVRNEWGLSDFYAKHIGSIAGTWELPRLSTRGALARQTLGGWSIAGRLVTRSGNPFNVVTGADNALTGTPQQRPNVLGDPLLPAGRTRGQQLAQWFNTAMFSAPGAGTFGNAGRNTLLGPGMQSTSAALIKNFSLPFREGLYVQFRSEVFNLTNTPIFKNPGNTLGSTFGRITSTSGGDRRLQFALKVVF